MTKNNKFKEQYLALDNQGQIDLINEKMRERGLAEFKEIKSIKDALPLVRQWNEEVMFLKEGHRNLVYKKQLEEEMLEEEYNELRQSKTLVERLDAIGDITFVFWGSMAKLGLMKHTDTFTILVILGLIEHLDIRKASIANLCDINKKQKVAKVDVILCDLLNVVAKSNYTKFIGGYSDKNGKFRKGESFVDPTHDLEKLILKYDLSE